MNARRPRRHHDHPPLKRCTRTALLFIFMGALACVIVARLYTLQVLAHEAYEAEAFDQHWLSADIEPERGEIFLQDDGDLYPLAINREYQTVYVVPREVDQPGLAAVALGDALGLPAASIETKLARKDDPFEIIKRRLSDEEAERVRKLGLKGVHFQPEDYRFYPGDGLASQVIGFASADDVRMTGRYGLEAAWDEMLRGTPGRVVQERGAGGHWISIGERDLKPAQHGSDLVLTVNRVIQFESERILRNAVEKFEADGGTIMVMEPKTGRLVAMASAPAFNPNEYQKEDIARFLNPAISLTYEPGSVMKPITMAIGLETGQVTPETTYVDTGEVKEAGYPLRNAEDKVYGRQTMTQVLEESINTGMIFVERLVGNQRFRDYLERFGFGGKTGIRLPAEAAGDLHNLDSTRRNLSFFTASFGQGVTVTPLQMLSAYAALANGGRLMQPQIVDRIVAPDGTVTPVPPQEVRRVVSEETAQRIGEMLRSVVVRGHGKRADVPGYRVGGKTGTAQVASSEKKGYDEHLTIGSFVGYAPVDDPRYAILVKIDHPKTVQWAESSAAPVFGELMKFLMEYAKVEPRPDLP